MCAAHLPPGNPLIPFVIHFRFLSLRKYLILVTRPVLISENLSQRDSVTCEVPTDVYKHMHTSMMTDEDIDMQSLVNYRIFKAIEIVQRLRHLP